MVYIKQKGGHHEKGAHSQQGQQEGCRPHEGVPRDYVLSCGVTFEAPKAMSKNSSPFSKEDKMFLKLIEKPYTEVKNEDAIVIFPSRPYWFSATKEIVSMLELLARGIDKADFNDWIIQNFALTAEEGAEMLEEVCELLFSNAVLTKNGCLTTEDSSEDPKHQLNSVENVLVIAATQNCNLSCPQCYANAKNCASNNEMKTEEIKALIDELSNMPWKNEISRVGLTGGEFFTRKDALEIIKYVHEKGFKVLISSNALLIDEDTVRELTKLKNIKISISLDGADAETHEYIRGKGTFQKTLKNIEALCKAGVFVGINMFVHAGNIDQIEKVLLLAKSLGVKSFNCLNMMHVGRANSKQSRIRLKSLPEYILNRILFEVLKDNRALRELMKNSTFANQVMGISAGVKSYYCGIGTNRALYIRADGNIYPCPDTVNTRFCLGNIRKDALQAIWDSSPILEELRRISVDSMNENCSICKMRYFCGGGCKGENYQVTKDLYSQHFNCGNIRKAITDIMWMLTEEPDFFQEKTESLYHAI